MHWACRIVCWLWKLRAYPFLDQIENQSYKKKSWDIFPSFPFIEGTYDVQKVGGLSKGFINNIKALLVLGFISPKTISDRNADNNASAVRGGAEWRRSSSSRLPWQKHKSLQVRSNKSNWSDCQQWYSRPFHLKITR